MQQCEYFRVDYVPALHAELRLPVGLFLFSQTGTLVRYRMAEDWRRVKCLDPTADDALLERLPAHFDGLVSENIPSLQETSDQASLRRELANRAENGSGAVQISAPRVVETENPEQEFEVLFAEHVAPRQPAASVRPQLRPGSRRWIHNQVEKGLERYGLSGRIERSVAVENFTAQGDRFRIDFGYQPNGTMRYLHALALDRDWNQAKVLSYTFGRIRREMASTMTAVVADGVVGAGMTQSCRQILEESEIGIQPLSTLDGFLANIRRELHL